MASRRIAAGELWRHLVESESVELFQSLFTAKPDSGDAVKVQLKSLTGISSPVMVHTICHMSEELMMVASLPEEGESAKHVFQQSQARFRSIIDSLGINLLLKDAQGRRIYANKMYLDRRKLKLSEVVGRTDHDLFSAQVADRYAADDRHVLATGAVLHKFEENFDADGTSHWIEIVKGPLLDADGKVNGVQILFWDASDRKQAEIALERERYLLHALLDNIPDSIYFKIKKAVLFVSVEVWLRSFISPNPRQSSVRPMPISLHPSTRIRLAETNWIL